ncbi:MAG TPA: HAD-IC family P-type ATPase, partial [Coriobacteriia bacterium]|nr:HAD-IC family P-type ATPase [Coriobacteriia bacterium]
LVGRETLMPSPPPEDLASEAAVEAASGRTVIWVAIKGAVAGFISLQDSLMPGASEAVDLLRDMRVMPSLLSGDSAATTRAIAEQLDIAEWQARLSPEDKARVVERWQASGELVLMVGDGVNDAPALAQADISVTAPGGTDVASGTADMVLTRRDVRGVPAFIRLSAITRRTTRENLGWALGYNLIAVPLAAFGVITPAIAAAMATSSLLVVGNSLRLRRLLNETIEPSASPDPVTSAA